MSDNKTNSDQPELIPGSHEVQTDSVQHITGQGIKPWSWSKKLAFRILFIFFLAMSIPVTAGWYVNAFTIDWFHPHYRDIYDIARFSPSYRALFGGRNEYDLADVPAANEPAGDTNKATRKQGRSNDSLGTSRNIGHHHGVDSVQVNNTAEVGIAKHHHQRVDSVLTAGQSFSAANGKHHRHHNDSVQTDSGKRLIAADGSSHSRPDSSRIDSSAHDSIRVASSAGNHRRNGDHKNDSQAPPKKNFLVDYTDWGIALLIGIVGGLIWTLIDRNRTKAYDILYYWIRVVVRYRAGIGIIGFGFTKLFPTQMPYPSLGLLNSNFGDFTAQKIYWMSVGIVPWYQVFGGIVEILAGGMLFFRKTSTFGALLLVGALGDITFVNYAYDGGVHVYAFYFVLLGFFILADDLPKLYNLLILERYTVPVRLYPDFRKPWLKYTRITLKALTFLIFFGILTYTEVINFKYDPYKQPSTAGVKQLRGNYHVTEFRINGRDIPYNPLDTTRWQEATFEKWTTLTFKVNRPVVIDPSNGGGSPMKDIQRTFEITGVAGGQRAFHYLADTVDHVLYLQDKNVMALRGGRGSRGGRNRANGNVKHTDNWISKTALQHIGDEKKLIDPHAWSTRRDREFAAKTKEPKRSRMILHYQTTDGNRVILSGVNEARDSIYVVLDRYNKKYTLPASTLVAGKY
ncbi:MFS transporter [Mucilaginibacter paludis]|uniref:DoxX family protein n=1 Tax=Mucilaginibacter paludis DSM 18603 TaxID=714943 RepID=H1Y589_9SPHI|nr:MFS transporter [Mucilaginibacter paludis]EHQ28900.1 hypothetical protein Mucpa_4815 [Mucilaginibacter paludis DSM 18603]